MIRYRNFSNLRVSSASTNPTILPGVPTAMLIGVFLTYSMCSDNLKCRANNFAISALPCDLNFFSDLQVSRASLAGEPCQIGHS